MSTATLDERLASLEKQLAAQASLSSGIPELGDSAGSPNQFLIGTNGKTETVPIPFRDILSVKDHGAKGNGTGNDAPSIQATMEAAREVGKRHSYLDGVTSLPIKQTVFVPDGTYLIDSPLELVQGVDLVLSPNAMIVAEAEMFAMLNGENTVLLQDQTVTGGVWNCNGKALHGLYLPYFAHMILPQINVYNPASHGVILGSAESLHPSFEAICGDLRVWRDHGQAIPAGSYGLWLQATDSTIDKSVVVGASTSYRIDGSHCTLEKCHGWGLPEIVFDDNGEGNTYIGPYADTPTAYGFILRRSGVRIIGGVSYKSVNGVDNTGVAFKIEGEETVIAIIGHRIEGSSPEKRWAKDFEGSLKQVTWVAKQSANVVTEKTANQIVGKPNAVGITIRRATGAGAPIQIIGPEETVNEQITSAGQLDLATLGAGLSIKEGANAKQGVSAAMVAGEVIVANTAITANSRLQLTRQAGGTHPGAVYEKTRTAGTSFVIASTNPEDTGTVAYEIFEAG